MVTLCLKLKGYGYPSNIMLLLNISKSTGETVKLKLTGQWAEDLHLDGKVYYCNGA